MFGDSNMNKVFLILCDRIDAVTQYKGLREGEVARRAYSWKACITPDGSLAVVVSVSWKQGGHALVHRPSALGQPLSQVLCRKDTLPEPPPGDCAAAWNVTAERTLVHTGSHNTEQLVPTADAAVRSWVHDILWHVRRPETVTLMLTSGMCVNRLRPHDLPQLFRSNNYRLRAVNEAQLSVAAERGWLVLDMWSVSLAAGCGGEAGDYVHYNNHMYVQVADILVRYF